MFSILLSHKMLFTDASLLCWRSFWPVLRKYFWKRNVGGEGRWPCSLWQCSLRECQWKLLTFWYISAFLFSTKYMFCPLSQCVSYTKSYTVLEDISLLLMVTDDCYRQHNCRCFNIINASLCTVHWVCFEFLAFCCPYIINKCQSDFSWYSLFVNHSASIGLPVQVSC